MVGDRPTEAGIASFLVQELDGTALPLSQEEFVELWTLMACAMRAFRDIYPGEDIMARFIALSFRIMCHYESLNSVRWENEEKGTSIPITHNTQKEPIQ